MVIQYGACRCERGADGNWSVWANFVPLSGGFLILTLALEWIDEHNLSGRPKEIDSAA